ncbi:hypothetical protein FCV25MIE_30953 [Fagus crenata]|jgi:hypothetical protein|uniref:Uncharacterized protein n=1 Tax=Fagus sylvatica TaxID=28930 RepID=A0A2N9FXB4_FAGSY
MSTGGAEGLFRCVYEGCICSDTGIERRPYHRNCGCALHKSGKECSHALPKCKNVSYPIRRAWSEGSLVLAASNYSSPSSSPAMVGAGKNQLGLCDEEEEYVSFKI